LLDNAIAPRWQSSRTEFYAVASAIDDSTNHSQDAPFVDEYLSTLENARIPIADARVLQSLPSGAFSGVFGRGDTFVTRASEPIAKVSQVQRELLQAYLNSKLNTLRATEIPTAMTKGTKSRASVVTISAGGKAKPKPDGAAPVKTRSSRFQWHRHHPSGPPSPPCPSR